MWLQYNVRSTKLDTNPSTKTEKSLPLYAIIPMQSEPNPFRGWSGSAMVLDKLPVPGRPTNFDDGMARAYCACGGCGCGLFGHFFSRLSFLFSFSLSLGGRPDMD